MAVTLSPGCAVQYFDARTGTEHLWGFGHLKMRSVPLNDEKVAIVKGTQMLGFNIGAGQENFYLGIGWDYRSRLSILETNTAITFIWPTNTLWLPGDLFRVRLGTNWPYQSTSPTEP